VSWRRNFRIESQLHKQPGEGQLLLTPLSEIGRSMSGNPTSQDLGLALLVLTIDSLM
jgi:hypothetical protein